MATTTTTSGRLRVPGAHLYYEVRGTGPLLLISESGDGDARRSVDLAGQLAEHYTVVTYDRRGLSRSALDDPDQAVTLADHAEDVDHLLATLTGEPVLMLGISLGAAIGLHLTARHPGRLSTLIAFEPVAPWLLPAAERAKHEREIAGVQDLYRRAGLAATFKEVAKVLGIDPASPDAEPGRTPQAMTPQRIANFGFFVERDFTAIIDGVLPLAALTDTTTRILPATGRATPRTVFDYRCAQELARVLHTETAELPGGHNGNLTHPRAWAAHLRRILRSNDGTGC
jgi:pimeloyl-ACP methyl ester carboxylesterase